MHFTCLLRHLLIYTVLPANGLDDSEQALHRSCCHSSKKDGSVFRGCGTDWQLMWPVQSPRYVKLQATKGLEVPVASITSAATAFYQLIQTVIA